MVGIKPTKNRKRSSSLFGATLLDEPTRSLGQPDAADEEDECPTKLNCDRDTVGSSIGTILCRVVDDGSQEKTDSDSKLVATNNCATDPLGGGLGLIERNCGTDHADSEASEEASSDEHRDSSGDGLQNDTDAEDNVASYKSKTATKKIS